jgi:hypothetical protein
MRLQGLLGNQLWVGINAASSCRMSCARQNCSLAREFGAVTKLDVEQKRLSVGNVSRHTFATKRTPAVMWPPVYAGEAVFQKFAGEEP